METKILSIIIPVFNTEKYIKECILSLYNQNLSDELFEIIFVNDGSTDKSVEYISDYIAIHNNIQLINQSNIGVSVARNNGLKIAKGKYILFIDSDDMLVQNCLEIIIKIATEYSLDILRTKYLKANNKEISEGLNIYQSIIDYSNLKVQSGFDGFVNNYNPNESYSFINLYRKDFITDNSFYFINSSFCEDVAFTVDTYLKADRFMYIPFITYIYRQHDNSAMSTMNKRKILSLNNVILYLSNIEQDKYTPKTKYKLNTCICMEINLLIWYMSHYKSLFRERKVIIKDMKYKLSKIKLKDDLRMIFISIVYNYFFNFYICIRYYLCNKKYK